MTAGSYSFSYDCNGNQTGRNVGSSYSLTYDAEGRLVGVSGAASASFTYDADGNLVKRVAGPPRISFMVVATSRNHGPAATIRTQITIEDPLTGETHTTHVDELVDSGA